MIAHSELFLLIQYIIAYLNSFFALSDYLIAQLNISHLKNNQQRNSSNTPMIYFFGIMIKSFSIEN